MMEEKAMIASIIRKYQIVSLNKTEEMKMYPEVTLRPQTGIYVKLLTRY